MRGLQKRVSWASNVNLCQVKLFLLEESPSNVGLSAQDHLQAKSSWLSHSSGTGSDDNLPPGFEGAHPANQLPIDVSQIPLIKWKAPLRVVLNLAWQVVAGEESKEVESENQRELRVLEAVYPRPSAIPPNPFVDVEESNHIDVQPLAIPITPIEEEDVAIDTSLSGVPSKIPTSSPSFLSMHGTPALSQSSAASNINLVSSIKQAVGIPDGVEPNVMAAASAAIGAIMNGNNEHGKIIDQELLFKILSNPKIIEKLVTDPQAVTRAASMTSSNPMPLRINNTESMAPPFSAAPSNAHFYPQANVGGMGHPSDPSLLSSIPISSSASVGPAPPKDINYYKSLIQQHGGDRQEAYPPEAYPPPYGNRPSHQLVNQESSFNGYNKSRDSRPRIMKPCIYFNSSRGCRHGVNCSFQHDASYQPQGSRVAEVQNPKRMKIDREISS